MKTTQRFSVLIWTDKRKMDASGLAPLYARITYLGQRAEISLKKKVAPANWDAKTGFVKGSSPESKRVNAIINQTLDGIDEAFKSLKRSEEFITAEKIKLFYSGDDRSRKMLLEVFDQHNADLEKLVNKDFVKATLTKYKTVRSKTANYIQHKYGKQDIQLESIDYAFVSGFEMYLKTVDNIEHNTAMRYIKNLKKIINLAVNNKWLIYNPFNAFKCNYRKVNRVELEWEEITTLAAHVFENAEERRVFYVAITRARNKNYLLYDALNPSKFLTELMQAPTTGNPSTLKCPECQGIMVKRKGFHNEFYGCSNYPQCKGTRPLLPNTYNN
jgi:hypothetical protein